jgi:hypothetical protein
MTVSSIDATAQSVSVSQNLAQNIAQSTPSVVLDPKQQRIQASVDALFPVNVTLSTEAQARLALAQSHNPDA